MSAEIFNLRKARKAKARAEKQQSAAANRARYGRSKADRQVEAIERDRLHRRLDGARRQKQASDPEPT